MVTHQPTQSVQSGPTITAKHVAGGDYQFDILDGRHANTIEVSHKVYDEYKVGDTYLPSN
ncbi:hypothetical protein ACRAWC_01495 [Leifsonia sp. L25]|uniref:hypothetical protein n=1 Tax=Actinomycetes TaxID=1760 RepID=UPI003D688451